MAKSDHSIFAQMPWIMSLIVHSCDCGDGLVISKSLCKTNECVTYLIMLIKIVIHNESVPK